MTEKKLSDVGEKKLVKDLVSELSVDDRLIGGFGHDSAFLDIRVNEDEYLMLNTDRSGMNVAYKLGLANGECVGDFGVSHAVSDIFASGGKPYAISIALMLPPSLTVNFVKEVMIGAQKAAKKYGAFIASGDTKHSNKFAMVVTVLGKCKRANALTRSGAKPGDYLVSTGWFGTMLSGLIAIKKNLNLCTEFKKILKNAVIYQNPPFEISRIIAEKKLAHAAMDNSDGIAGTLYDICHKSNVGVVVMENKIPMLDATKEVAKILNKNPFELCLGSGDWQHIFAVPKENIETIIKLSNETNCKVEVIGRFNASQKVGLETPFGLYELKCLENDRFMVGGSAWFDLLSSDVNYLGNKI